MSNTEELFLDELFATGFAVGQVDPTEAPVVDSSFPLFGRFQDGVRAGKALKEECEHLDELEARVRGGE